MPVVAQRSVSSEAFAALARAGVPPVLARIYAARGVASPRELQAEFRHLLPAPGLRGIDAAAELLADAVRDGRRIVIVADYDSDGATACAVGMGALRAFGATVDYLVPNRFEYGYGLTPEIVRLARDAKRPDLLVTVDNGIASLDGVAEANRLGIGVLVTDHHLPGDGLPEALAIVNPNQPGCGFPSKCLAGVGVIFYVMLALRAELRRCGAFAARPEPNLADFLDLVALGTVADVVKLDHNNRILVQQGLKRIRAGRARPGVAALFECAGRDIRRASVYDLGFILGPRLNAAGRLDDMSRGIECLLCDDGTRAQKLAADLDALNRERRAIEADMQEAALAAVSEIDGNGYSLCLARDDWHQGVIGILASRLKERLHRPVIAFAPDGKGCLKGSGRAIPGIHLRDALDLVAKRCPGLLVKFGGHAAAAGLTIREEDFDRFADAFDGVARELLSPADLDEIIETDGFLQGAELSLETARLLADEVWGQGFPPPRFGGEFAVLGQRVVGEKHLKLKLGSDGHRFDAILFSETGPLPARIHAVYRLSVNEYGGAESLELCLDHWQPAGDGPGDWRRPGESRAESEAQRAESS